VRSVYLGENETNMRVTSIALVLVFAVSASADDQPPMRDRLVHATAWVRAGAQGVGTGWVVDAKKKLLITNLHVVGEQDRVEAFFIDDVDGMPISERDHYLKNQASLHERGRAVGGKVIAREPKCDLALIELTALPPRVIALPLAALPAAVGTHIHFVGHRHDAETLWNHAEGSIRQTGILGDGYFWRGKKLAVNARCLIAQLPIVPGESGAAVVNDDGEVVGVLAGLRSAPSSAIVIDASEVRQLLAIAEQAAKAKPSTVVETLLKATAWVRPTATEGRAAGFVFDVKHRLMLTTATASGTLPYVDVIFPKQTAGVPIVEAAAYGDAIGLRQEENLVRGWVLARDPSRDLALVELDMLPEGTVAIPFAKQEAKPGDTVHTMSHSGAVELLWLYARGTVRQSATLEVKPDIKARTLLLQLPHQGGSSGGPVVNAAGELTGMLSVREAAQGQMAYAVGAGEVSAFVKEHRQLVEPIAAADYLERAKRLGHRYKVLEDGHRKFPMDPMLLEELVVRGDAEEEWEKAAAYARTLVKLVPEATPYLCLALTGSKNPDEREYVRKELTAKPDQPLLLLAYSRQLDSTEAMKQLDRAIELSPNLLPALIERAARRMNSHRDPERLLADAVRIIELDPLNDAGWMFRRSANFRLEQHKASVAAAERLVELFPLSGYQHSLLAAALQRAGEETRAIESHISALRCGSDRRGTIRLIEVHAEALAKLYPDDPDRAKQWTARALKAIESVSVLKK